MGKMEKVVWEYLQSVLLAIVLALIDYHFCGTVFHCYWPLYGTYIVLR
jgi:hypothetical protein